MSCCGLCRPKVKTVIKSKKNITAKKINTIDLWMENIEGPYELIDLPSKSPSKPMKMNNQAEIDEMERNAQSSDTSASSEQSEISEHGKGKSNGQRGVEDISSDLSASENDSNYHPKVVFHA